LLNGPDRFTGRKVGALVTDGVDVKVYQSLKKALADEGAQLEVIAPRVGGVKASDGTWIEASEQVGGGPSVLYDAVALLPSEAGVKTLAKQPAARDFVADAFAHLKFIGYVKTAMPLLEKAGVAEHCDDGFIELSGSKHCTKFVEMCRKVRYWAREAAM
jgi:catalase